MWFDIAARSEKLELLDGDMFDEADLRENLTEIELVNRLLGGMLPVIDCLAVS